MIGNSTWTPGNPSSTPCFQKDMATAALDTTLTCPFHQTPLIHKTSERTQFPYVKCELDRDCPLFCKDDPDSLTQFMTILHTQTDPTWFQDWNLICDCGYVATTGLCKDPAKKNYGRAYVTCNNANQDDKCVFFHWLDKPKKKKRPQGVITGVQPIPWYLKTHNVKSYGGNTIQTPFRKETMVSPSQGRSSQQTSPRTNPSRDDASQRMSTIPMAPRLQEPPVVSRYPTVRTTGTRGDCI